MNLRHSSSSSSDDDTWYEKPKRQPRIFQYLFSIPYLAHRLGYNFGLWVASKYYGKQYGTRRYLKRTFTMANRFGIAAGVIAGALIVAAILTTPILIIKYSAATAAAYGIPVTAEIGGIIATKFYIGACLLLTFGAAALSSLSHVIFNCCFKTASKRDTPPGPPSDPAEPDTDRLKLTTRRKKSEGLVFSAGYLPDCDGQNTLRSAIESLNLPDGLVDDSVAAPSAANTTKSSASPSGAAISDIGDSTKHTLHLLPDAVTPAAAQKQKDNVANIADKAIQAELAKRRAAKNGRKSVNFGYAGTASDILLIPEDPNAALQSSTKRSQPD